MVYPKLIHELCALRFLHIGYHIDTEVQISQFLQQLTLMVYHFTIMLYGPKIPTNTIRADLMHQITYYRPLDKISVILALFDHKPSCYQDL